LNRIQKNCSILKPTIIGEIYKKYGERIMRLIVLFIISFLTIIDLSPLFSQENVLTLLKSFPDPKSVKSDDYLAHPYDLVKYKQCYIVTDAREACIKVFSTDGDLIRVIGSEGMGPGELLNPYVFTIDKKKGIIYCGDQGNKRISCFNFNGEYLKVIKSNISIHDLQFNNGSIITASYNETNKTLFTMYDTIGVIKKLFGEFFDPEIEKKRYGYLLYKDVCLDVNKDSIYVFYERLPLIQVYNEDGEFVRKINIQIKEIQDLYISNLRGAGEKKSGGRILIYKWIFGAQISNNKIYCYSPYEMGCTLVMDLSGNLIQKLYFSGDPPRSWQIVQKLVEIDNDKLVFLDLENSQVKIYMENN
jgi:hypothetical protein